MKIYISDPDSIGYLLERDNTPVWKLTCKDFAYKARELTEIESKLVESVYQHFAEPMKKLLGE